ncbi:MAG: OmpA family protein, partial [Spirochaetia bacterium]|nr:OmpA family protein [Spirochaetia bacterium]
AGINSIFPDSTDEILFEFDLEPEDVLVVNKYQDIKMGTEYKMTTKEEKNKISLKVLKKEGNAAVLKGNFHTYSRTPKKTGEFKSEKEFLSQFKIFKNGAYEVGEEYIMPNLRSLPTFPDHKIKTGSEWKAPAEETLDIRDVKIHIPLTVQYKYTGKSEYTDPQGKKHILDRIEYRYAIDHVVKDRKSGIKKITGFSVDELWFDTEKGIPVFDSNRLVYHFVMLDGNILHYNFHIDSWYKKIRHLKKEDKKEIADKLKHDLKKEKDITVRENEDGIILDMNAVFFDYNSHKLSGDAEKKLKKIEKLLRKFPDREIRISGHTDSRGSASYNLKLSEARAKSVLEALKKIGDIDSKRLSYKGYGEEKPVESNLTEEGRSKNRRVEILIVTE